MTRRDESMLAFALLVMLAFAGCAEKAPPQRLLVLEAPVGESQWGDPAGGLQAGLEVMQFFEGSSALQFLAMRLRYTGGEHPRIIFPDSPRVGVVRLEMRFSDGSTYTMPLPRPDGSQRPAVPDPKYVGNIAARSVGSMNEEGYTALFSLSAEQLSLKPPLSGELRLIYANDHPQMEQEAVWTGRVSTRGAKFHLAELPEGARTLTPVRTTDPKPAVAKQ
jgi:hypothetical protein